MANISKDTNAVNANAHGGADVTNWISQINAGGTIYDIATHHSVTFREGQGGATTVWNGLTDIEVVIPTITDIVQSPIEFAGTVGASGEVEWNSAHADGPKTGYLVFVTADCTFGDYACEAGDMAIYDGSKWNVVSGENQVKIVAGTAEGVAEGNRTTIAVGSAKDVLVVEGKALALTLDYTEIDKHITLTPGDVETVTFGDVTVDSTYIKLTQDAGSDFEIAEDVNIDVPTQLKDGKVELKGATGLVNSITFGTFNPGTLPSFTPNSEKQLSISGGNLVAGTGSDYVSDVTFGNVTFKPADASDENKISMITGITAGEGTEFFKGVHVTKANEGETADFTIKGYTAPTNGITTKFVEGLEDNLTPVTSVTGGDFKLIAGNDLATGFGEEKNDKTGEVLSDVTVVANNNASVLSTATVTDHVLSFGSVNVTDSITTTYKSKSLSKTGFEYTPVAATNTNFVTSGFTNVADVDYTFDRKKETIYTPDTASWKLDTPELNVTKGAYTIDRTTMKATVPAGVFVGSADAGTLPSYEGYDFGTTDVTGSVSTELTTAKQTIHAVKSGVTAVAMPGAYHLVNESGDGAIEVAAAGDSVNITATVDLEGYVTDVTIA